MTVHNSLFALLIAAAAFYIPILSLLIIGRRSWVDVLAVGAVVIFFCITADVLLPPLGLVAFALFHAVWICGWLRSAMRSRKKPNEETQLKS